MKLTIFIPSCDGLYDSDYGPHVYEGHLKRAEIERIGRDLVRDAYPEMAVSGDDNTSYYISYNNEPGAEPSRTEYGTEFEPDSPGVGDLAYFVEFRETKSPPIAAD